MLVPMGQLAAERHRPSPVPQPDDALVECYLLLLAIADRYELAPDADAPEATPPAPPALPITPADAHAEAPRGTSRAGHIGGRRGTSTRPPRPA